MPFSPRLDAVKFVSRTQATAQALREAIIAGELVGGDRILEQHWAKRLGIGQPTLREAMRELEYQGLLRRTVQRGTYVAELSPDDYRQIMEVRLPLEAIAIGLATANLTDEVEQELVAIVDAMAATQDETDVRRFHDCDVIFHRTIWKAASNPYLGETLEAITFRLFVFSIVGRWPQSPNAAIERRAAIRQHVGILTGIRTRDPMTARRAYVDETVTYWNEQYGLELRFQKSAQLDI